jgi:hypothetical protein
VDLTGEFIVLFFLILVSVGFLVAGLNMSADKFRVPVAPTRYWSVPLSNTNQDSIIYYQYDYRSQSYHGVGFFVSDQIKTVYVNPWKPYLSSSKHSARLTSSQRHAFLFATLVMIFIVFGYSQYMVYNFEMNYEVREIMIMVYFVMTITCLILLVIMILRYVSMKKEEKYSKYVYTLGTMMPWDRSLNEFGTSIMTVDYTVQEKVYTARIPNIPSCYFKVGDTVPILYDPSHPERYVPSLMFSPTTYCEKVDIVYGVLLIFFVLLGSLGWRSIL